MEEASNGRGASGLGNDVRGKGPQERGVQDRKQGKIVGERRGRGMAKAEQGESGRDRRTGGKRQG